LGHEDGIPYLEPTVNIRFYCGEIAHFSAVHPLVCQVIENLFAVYRIAIFYLRSFYKTPPNRFTDFFVQFFVFEQDVNPTQYNFVEYL